MVMLSSWWREPLSNGKRSEGQMNSEDCGLRVPSPALARCLKKAEDRGLLDEDCPWCSANGQTNILRSYAVNFKESITLCTSLQCLYSLVSRPLDNIRASLSSAQDFKGCKRKSDLSEFSNLQPTPKQPKTEESNGAEVKCVDPVDPSVSAKSLKDELILHERRETGNDNRTCIKVDAVSVDSGLSDVLVEVPLSGTQDEACNTLQANITPDLTELVPTQPHLFWKNTDNLCWLDSLLVALVNLKVLGGASCKDEGVNDNISSNKAIVMNLCTKYNMSCAYLKAKEQHFQAENVIRVPSDVLQKTEQGLAGLRQSAFQLLQPKLQCEIGQKDTPVFALPLLLRSDDWANSYFQHVGQWEFKCTSCGYELNTRVKQTVTTFTQVMADWHPLVAVHRAPCNSCLLKNQRRKLVLERISSVFVLHFVEGLPQRDVSRYSFDFKGTHYSVRAIIQYNKQLKHFVTWIHQPDGSWLEFDDLKYPNCITHRRLTLPANQLHLVFWEAESQNDSLLNEPVLTEDTLGSCIESGSFEHIDSVPDDRCILGALTVSGDKNEVNTLDSSIGSTTLLDTFEGLSHNDIVTLTLVEVKLDAEGKTLPNIKDSVVGPAESTVTNVSPVLDENSPCLPNKKMTNTEEVLSSLKVILPSVGDTLASAAVEPTQESQSPPALSSSNSSASNLPLLFQRHPSHQSTPFRAPFDPSLKPDLKCESSEALPAKPAELFGGYRGKNSSNPVLRGGLLRSPLVKPSTVSLSQKSFTYPAAPGQASALPKCAGRDTLNLSTTMTVVSTTDALRIKLLKKLKAKKKKLAKLNQILSKDENESVPRPDSTDVCSPYSVTSSTSGFVSPAYENFFAELLSPTTSTSNLSPDSTDLMDKLNNDQGAGTSESIPQDNLSKAMWDLSPVFPEQPVNNPSSTNDDFLDEFISGSRLEKSAIENTDLNALDMFF